MRLLNRFEPPSHSRTEHTGPSRPRRRLPVSGDSFSYRQVVSARPQRSRSQLDGFPPALGFACGGGCSRLGHPVCASRSAEEPAASQFQLDPSPTIRSRLPQEALPNTTPSNTAPAAAPSLNQRQSRPQPLPAFESRKRRRSRFNLRPSPPSRNQPAIRRLYRQRHSRTSQKSRSGRRGWRLRKRPPRIRHCLAPRSQ